LRQYILSQVLFDPIGKRKKEKGKRKKEKGKRKKEKLNICFFLSSKKFLSLDNFYFNQKPNLNSLLLAP